MSDQPSKKGSVPFSLRFTPEERDRLERAAAGRPLGTYIRERILGAGPGEAKPRRGVGSAPIKDRAALAQVLAALGASDLARSLADMAQAARSGSFPVTPETEADLRTACQAITEMKQMLMKALGFRDRP